MADDDRARAVRDGDDFGERGAERPRHVGVELAGDEAADVVRP